MSLQTTFFLARASHLRSPTRLKIASHSEDRDTVLRQHLLQKIPSTMKESLLLWVVTTLITSVLLVGIANNASSVVKVENDIFGESFIHPSPLDETTKALSVSGSTDTGTIILFQENQLSLSGTNSTDVMKHPLLIGFDQEQLSLSRGQTYFVAPVLQLRGGGGNALINSKDKQQCKWDIANQPGTDLSLDEPARKTLRQHGAYNHPEPPDTNEVNSLLSFNSDGMIIVLDKQHMLTHHREDVFDEDNGYLINDLFLVCARAKRHSGVYLARLNSGILKVGRMVEMCLGAMDRDEYDPKYTKVVFDLDRCGSTCLDGISNHIMKVKEQVPSLDYKTVTTVEFLQYEINNGGITPLLDLFLHLSLDKGGINKAGVERAVILSLAESSVQTHWKGDVGPTIDSGRSVHEWIYYPAAVSIVNERQGNAINFWNHKMSKILSEEGILLHPLAEMTVTVHPASSSWKPPRPHIDEVSLVDIKREVREIVADSDEVEELVLNLESKFGIDMSEVDVDGIALTDSNRWFEVAKQTLESDLASNSKQVVAATRVVYDRIFKVDGSYENRMWFNPIEISNDADWGYNTNLMECSERESGRVNTELNLQQAKVTVGDPEKGEHSLVIVLADKLYEGFRSTPDCEIEDSIEAMMKRQDYKYLATYNQVDHYSHRNKDCQTTIALVHRPGSNALKSTHVWMPGLSEEQKDDSLDSADSANYMQGFIQKLRHPSEPFLSNQLASENLVLANTFLRYLDDQWHLLSVIATKFAKEFLLLNNESINSLDPEYGHNAGPVTQVVHGEEKKDYNVGWKLANELSRRIVRKTVGTFRDEDRNMKHFLKEALGILSENGRSNKHISGMIRNIKELKQDTIDAIQDAHQKAIKKRTKKRSAENARVSNETIERMNRARTT